MDHPLRTISYIADIGNIVVLMARRRMPRPDSQETVEASDPGQESRRQYKMICHVFESEDVSSPRSVPPGGGAVTSGSDPPHPPCSVSGPAHRPVHRPGLQRGLPGVLAGQRHKPGGPEPEGVQRPAQHAGHVQRRPHPLLQVGELQRREPTFDLLACVRCALLPWLLCSQVLIEKAKGEILGVVIVESGWGSILPTVIIANMMHAGPAERSGRLNIGDQIMSINGTSLVGLPLSTCQSIIKVSRSMRGEGGFEGG